ncbi:hypothetical protein [Belnapia sp. F-4-1]|uniref:Abi-alpha family protein n=1 Tax=Belnapia sp. F-4-1 TaxID=1545443 RepID=UPI0011853B56|nr:hypothetical protein [Belnapia sp. F-4-1]
MPIESPVSLQLKAEVKTEIPSASTGRLMDALVDIVRPFSERRGLKADLIRVQRDEVAFRALQLAHHHISTAGLTIKPIPNKGLVQLLEKASLEEIEDEVMVSMWANLLATAATTDSDNLPRFVNILSELNGQLLILLEKIITHNLERLSFHQYEHVIHARLWADTTAITAGLNDEIAKAKDTSDDASDEYDKSVDEIIMLKIKSVLDQPGIAVDVPAVTVDLDGESYEAYLREDFKDLVCQYSNDDQLDYAILESLNLIKQENISGYQIGDYKISAVWYRATVLGVQLFARCNPGKITTILNKA